MENQVIRSLCGFCHANCGVKVHMRDGRISRVEGDTDHPVNRGYLCPKANGIKPLLDVRGPA